LCPHPARINEYYWYEWLIEALLVLSYDDLDEGQRVHACSQTSESVHHSDFVLIQF